MNGHNQIKNTNIESSSKYKGVCWSKNEKKWKSTCILEKKTEHLGYFESEEEAAKAYDTFTFIKIGEKANNNNLVKYEDTLEIDIDDIVKKPSNKYDIPKNILFHKPTNKFIAQKKYNKKKYTGTSRETVEDALKDFQRRLKARTFGALY
jgi:hypothetical protein